MDTLNSKYNEKCVKSHNNVKEVKGYANTKLRLHKNLQLMAHRTGLNTKCYNSEGFTVIDFDDECFYSNTQKGHSKYRH